MEKAATIPTAALDEITLKPETTTDRPELSDSIISDSKAHLEAGNTGSTIPLNSSPASPASPASPGMMPQTPGIKLGDNLGEKRAVDMLDIIVPTIIVLAGQYLLELKIDKRALQLNADEKKVLGPFLKDFLNTLKINTDNPLYNLVIAASLIYGPKLLEMPAPERIIKRVKDKTPVAPIANNPDLNLANFLADFDARIKETIAKTKKSRKAVIEKLQKDGTLIRELNRYGLKNIDINKLM